MKVKKIFVERDSNHRKTVFVWERSIVTAVLVRIFLRRESYAFEMGKKCRGRKICVKRFFSYTHTLSLAVIVFTLWHGTSSHHTHGKHLTMIWDSLLVSRSEKKKTGKINASERKRELEIYVMCWYQNCLDVFLWAFSIVFPCWKVSRQSQVFAFKEKDSQIFPLLQLRFPQHFSENEPRTTDDESAHTQMQ